MLLLLFTVFASAAQATLIPGPPGPYEVANEVHQLTDESRWDIFAPPGITHKRRIMVSTFLPVDAESCTPEIVPYMPPQTTVAYGLYANGMGLPADLFEGYEFQFCETPDAQSLSEGCKYPLVLFSPGLTASRLLYTAQARALASYGYAVITIDHPYDAAFVEFPDGTGVNATLGSPINETLAEKAVEVRVQDASFVIDLLEGGLGGESFPEAFSKSVDLERIVMYGHSLGGATAAGTAYSDDRVLGGMDVDGSLYGPVVEAGLDKPFLLTGRSFDEGDSPPWMAFYEKLRGPKLMTGVSGATHYSFIDARLLFATTGIPEDMLPLVEELTGTIDGYRLEEIVQGVLKGLLDLVLRDDPDSLLAIDEDFPEVFVRLEDLVV